MVVKILYAPFAALSGLLSGALASRVFRGLWRLIDKEQPPEPQYREISLVKLLVALMLQGAVFRAVRGLVNHGSRAAFSRLTGRWPGEERPEPRR